MVILKISSDFEKFKNRYVNYSIIGLALSWYYELLSLVLKRIQKTTKNTMETKTVQQELFVKMILSAWDTQNSNLDKLAATLTDEQFLKEIAPGKNTGIYLFGHLIAVNDAMLPLLGFGEKLFPQLEDIFIKNPDKSHLEKPSLAELKEYLKVINAKLAVHIQSTTPAEWFRRHTAVSEEDFAKEPYRNKLNVMISRTNHMSYHLGQMALLK